MPNDIAEVEAKLRKLADLLHRGWEKRCLATEKEMEAVRKVAWKYLQKKQKAKCANPEEIKVLDKVAKMLSSVKFEFGQRFMLLDMKEPKELPEAQEEQLPVRPLLTSLKRKKAVRKSPRKKVGGKISH